MKYYILIPTIGYLLGIGTVAQGLVNLGEGGGIFLSASGSVYRDTAIRSRSSGQEDTIYTVRTALTYTRPSRLFDLSASVGLTAQRYAEFDQYDDDNVSLALDFSPSQSAQARTSTFTFTGNLILKSTTDVDEQIGEIINKRTYGLSLEVLYDPNSHYNLRLLTSATREDPDSSVYNQIDRYSAGLTLEVPMNEETLIELGGSYLKTESDQSTASQGETITAFAGLNGLLLPKLSGFIRGGIQSRKSSGYGDSTGPYASSGLTWAIDDSTNAALLLSHQFGTNINDSITETTSASISISRELNRRLRANGSVRYSNSDLTATTAINSRTTELVGISGGVSYSLNRFSSLSADVSYSDSTSSDANFEFDRWRIGATLSASW